MIRRYGGVVEKFIGDAVMAVWGTPVATESDAERAVRAALDLVAAVAGLGAPIAARLARRPGRRGHGRGGRDYRRRRQAMVAGDAVNTAARVQARPRRHGARGLGYPSVAGPAIGFDRTLTSIPEGQDRAGAAVAGHAGRLRRRRRAARGRARGALLGRDAEFGPPQGRFHASADRRRPRMVLVSGPAGVGKSRLGWEFWKYVDGLVDGVYWHHGRCLSYGEGMRSGRWPRSSAPASASPRTTTGARSRPNWPPRWHGFHDEAERDFVGPAGPPARRPLRRR